MDTHFSFSRYADSEATHRVQIRGATLPRSIRFTQVGLDRLEALQGHLSATEGIPKPSLSVCIDYLLRSHVSAEGRPLVCRGEERAHAGGN